MTDRHVLVLAGGLTHEREVSLRSGARLTDALRRHDVEVTLRDADADLLPWIAAHRPDSAVIALHGGRGENGAVQGILEMTETPFTGSRSHACRLAWDKPTAKTLLQRAGYRHSGLDHAGAQHVPRSRRRCGDRRHCDPHGSAADAQAAPGWVRARRRRGAAARGPARGVGRCLRLRLGGDGRAVRHRDRVGDHRHRGRRRAPRPARRRDRLSRASTSTTSPATPPAPRRTTHRPG